MINHYKDKVPYLRDHGRRHQPGHHCTLARRWNRRRKQRIVQSRGAGDGRLNGTKFREHPGSVNA
jgi:hypothetical protein